MNNQVLSVPEKNTPFFCSWSGGKDSCLALYRARHAGAKPARLLTMLAEDGIRSRSHGLTREVLQAQSSRLGIPLLSPSASWSAYESVFTDALHQLKKEGVPAGVFGDIDFSPHREWDEKVCALTGLILCLPLWECSKLELLDQFLALGFKAMIVTVKEEKLGREFLGRTIDREIIGEFQRMGIDPCGENGEYHTVVVDGPLFSAPLLLDPGVTVVRSGYCMLEVRVRI
ncbi:MAG: diphthine--ammonia ligase [Verrucomicrobia bacterium]|nr:diphthine--ammonia ligase [Verrucomicrobiota bacterium]MBU4291014.1 diphthine--ammonia ligase [Verrucomicrobiota bacterium]MBU4429903.1 diphthine--ammonia ligase [Verrucomicrobiota bacterium]MCG2678904.1 diphthine--ammonia ligase [Kiritimatiellia bacterium]